MSAQPRCGDIRLRFEYWPVIWLWPISLVLMQVTLATVGDFSITVAVIACHLLQLHLITFYWLSRPPDWQIALALAILGYSLVAGALAREPVEFVRSFAHVTNLLLTVMICLNARLGRADEVARSLALFCVLASAVALLIIVQALSFNLLRDFRLAGLLGDFAPLGPGGQIYTPAFEATLPRAHGLYSEPSVAGWFMTYALAIALAARRLYPGVGALAAATCSLAAMATLSLTGILGATLVWTGYLVLVRDSRRFKALAGLLAGAGVVVALHQAHELGILARFAHLDNPGTSIYFRLNAPYRLISESIERFPLGYPLGQIDFIASRHYYINWDQGSQTNIDNTLLMIVFYFGLLGVLLNLGYALKAAQFLLIRRHAVGLIMLSLLIAASTTGAGWAHHFVLMIGYAIVVGRCLLDRIPVEPAVARWPLAGWLIRRRSAGPPPEPAARRAARSLAAWQA